MMWVRESIFLQFALSSQRMNDSTANHSHVARNKTMLERRVETLTALRWPQRAFCPCSLPVRALSISTAFKGSINRRVAVVAVIKIHMSQDNHLKG